MGPLVSMPVRPNHACSLPHRPDPGPRRLRRATVPVVLISIDTLRPDHLGCYGYARPTSPNLDAFRKDAILFTQCLRARAIDPRLARRNPDLSPAASPWGLDRQRLLGVPRGRDPGRGDAGGRVVHGLIQRRRPAGRLLRARPGLRHLRECQAPRVRPREPGGRDRPLRPRGRAGAATWIETQRGRAFFLFLHTYEVHHPYTPEERDLELFRGGSHGPLPDQITMGLLEEVNDGKRTLEPRDRQHIVDTYDAEIRSADRAFGTLMALLRTLGLYDDALVVVTSDHGEEFGEHGQMGWHSRTLYDELLHVPLIVKLPGSGRAGTTVEETVRGIDVAPTVLATLGKTPPSGFEGRDVLGFWPSPAGAAEVWSSRDVTTPAGLFALRTPDWKLIDRRLYDLRHDPGERSDVAGSEPEVMKRMTSRRLALLESRPRPRPERARINEELRRRLRALGYLD